jgi:hypothetical protein
MLTVEDYKRLSHQAAELAIASEDPFLGQALLQLALDFMRQAATLSETVATEEPRQRGQQDSIDGFGD